MEKSGTKVVIHENEIDAAILLTDFNVPRTIEQMSEKLIKIKSSGIDISHIEVGRNSRGIFSQSINGYLGGLDFLQGGVEEVKTENGTVYVINEKGRIFLEKVVARAYSSNPVEYSRILAALNQ